MIKPELEVFFEVSKTVLILNVSLAENMELL